MLYLIQHNDGGKLIMLSCHVYCHLKKHNPDFLIHVNIVNSEGQVGTHEGGIMKKSLSTIKICFGCKGIIFFLFILSKVTLIYTCCICDQEFCVNINVKVYLFLCYAISSWR